MKLLTALLCLATLHADWSNYKNKIHLAFDENPGFCSWEKAELLMDFIEKTKPTLCVEIGAFGGKTTYPLLSALAYNQKGKLFAVDSWEANDKVKGLDPYHRTRINWENLQLNMQQFYLHFMHMVYSKNLGKFCTPVKEPLQKALSRFEDNSIDFLYIDGNFSREGSLQEVALYFPKVKKGGYIFLNDADMITKNKAVSFLMKNARWLKEQSLGTNCVLFQK